MPKITNIFWSQYQTRIAKVSLWQHKYGKATFTSLQAKYGKHFFTFPSNTNILHELLITQIRLVQICNLETIFAVHYYLFSDILLDIYFVQRKRKECTYILGQTVCLNTSVGVLIIICKAIICFV